MHTGLETTLSLTCFLLGHFGQADVFHWGRVATEGLGDSDTGGRKTNRTCDRHRTDTSDTPVSYSSSLSLSFSIQESKTIEGTLFSKFYFHYVST